MSKERWHKETKTAFKFWEQLLSHWDTLPISKGCFGPAISHLKRFEQRTEETFKYIVGELKADPVYVLHVLIHLCEEEKINQCSGIPQMMTQSACGTFDSDLKDYHLVTQSDWERIKASVADHQSAGLALDRARIKQLGSYFEQAYEPALVLQGYTSERAILYTEFEITRPRPETLRGRPGEHPFNTTMCLLARHFERTSPRRWASYSSIAHLLNGFCPATFDPYPLTRPSVRQRILSLQDRVEGYCKGYEHLFELFKESIQIHRIPFNPWPH